MVKLGMRFWVNPAFTKRDDGKSTTKKQAGKVVWIHPKGRYAVLEFEGVTGSPRESFHMLYLTEENLVREKKKWR